MLINVIASIGGLIESIKANPKGYALWAACVTGFFVFLIIMGKTGNKKKTTDEPAEE